MNEKWNVVQESLYNIDWKMKISVGKIGSPYN